MVTEIAGRGEFAALVIRTDHSDEAAWRVVTAELRRPWGDHGEFEADVHLIEDPVWTEATSDAVLAVVSRDERLRVVFLADHVTMRSGHRALLALALAVGAEDEDLDPAYYHELVDSASPRAFRTVPAGVRCAHTNLSLANLGFEDYAEVAIADPEGVFRSF